MKILKLSAEKNPFFICFIVGLAVSTFFLILSFLLPTLISSNYYQKSLNQLRNKAESIKNEFNKVIDTMHAKQKSLSETPFPEKKDEIFALFQQLDPDTEREGIGYYKQGTLTIWLGSVIDLDTISHDADRGVLFEDQKSTFLVHNKASFYLVSFHKVDKDSYIAFYHLLAYLPQFKAHYLREYHFLKQKYLKNCNIDYKDFREDVSGDEKFFERHKDEYVGQPQLQSGIQTIFFPLRNEKNKIIAEVTLNSPSIYSKISTQKEDILLLFYLLSGTSLIFLLIYLLKTSVFLKARKPLLGLFIIMLLVGLRLIFFPLSKLEKVQSLSIFSPSSASFLSFWDFTKSPADIFLTSLFLFLIVGCLALYFRDFFKIERKKHSASLSLVFNILFIFISVFLIHIFQETLYRLVSNSNLNMLHFSFEPSFFLLHLSILFFFFVFFIASLTGLRAAFLFSNNFLLFVIIFCLEFAGFFYLFRKENPPLLFLFQALIIVLIAISGYFPKVKRKKEFLFASLLIITLFVYVSVHDSTSSKNRSLLQNSLKNIIISQEDWGVFLIEQSLPEIDRNREEIISSLQSLKPSDLAHSLWERTLIAKFNWYSSLEILDPEGLILSRFSLNVPELYRLDTELPLSQEWTIFHPSIPFLGREKEFLIGYKDFFDEGVHVGKVVIYLSVDYDMLPFLYSANPYFELMRVTSIPSLNQLNLGFAIFDLDGKLLFNPDKISTGIPINLLQKIQSSEDSIWSFFTDKQKKFLSLYFRHNNRIFSLFLPEKRFLNYSVEFLKLFFFYFALSIFFTFLFSFSFGRKKLKNPFWSFSNRVYISFMAIALIPFLLFTFSTRSFFARIFAQQFTEEAEVQANFAHKLVEDFIYTQQEEQVSLTIPPDNLVLLISSIISNDVNLYQDGRLISSSRREFFDYGIHPELINGEIFYKIQYENNPFYTQTRKIGDYSFHTLTIPFTLLDSLLLVSLPFPFEQQEISKATEELIEFLLFISVFFIAIVLLFARGIGGMIVTPIKNLLTGTKEVSLGNLEISIPHKYRDEMKTLVDGFNAMVKNLKKHQQELADMSKKVAWAEMARKVAHEIKNPLTPIQLSAEHLLRVYEDKKEDFDETLKESVSYIIKEVDNLRKIAHEFLEISKETGLQKEALDLKVIIQETIEPYKKVLSERIPMRETYKGNDFNFLGDKSKIKIVLRNIFTNAIEAIRKHGRIEIKVSSDKKNLTLSIKDTGVGIDNDVFKKIFDPYFSTKDVGTGLGLPIAKKIIEDHGGSIQASSKEKEGTTILIKLPKSREI